MRVDAEDLEPGDGGGAVAAAGDLEGPVAVVAGVEVAATADAEWVWDVQVAAPPLACRRRLPRRHRQRGEEEEQWKQHLHLF